LDEFLEIIGDREIAVVKELTKIYENIFRGKISEIKPQLNENNLKGEFIVILGPYKESPKTTDYDSVIKRVNYYLKTGKTKKEIVSLISNEFGLKRNEAYKIIHDRMEV
ncbi:MAG: hypothetical protein N2114_03110, partial [Candidatus Goldbacteria bacterium]|nr:hypothetical protein [Candidatus Goldiibacteriota bacterium]